MPEKSKSQSVFELRMLPRGFNPFSRKMPKRRRCDHLWEVTAPEREVGSLKLMHENVRQDVRRESNVNHQLGITPVDTIPSR